MIDSQAVREGMSVFSSDGEKLGKVLSCEGGRVLIEKGFFFPKDYVARLEDVRAVREDEIHLARTKDELTRERDTAREGSYEGTASYGSTGIGSAAGEIGADRDRAMGSLAHESSGLGATGRATPGAPRLGEEDLEASGAGARSEEEVRVPVAEEELDVTKRDRAAGEVRLRKDVVTEHRRVDVPVTREEIRVERVPASETRGTAPGEGAFEQKTVSVPLREEEIEITKRPVVKEEVRLRKERVVEQRAADAEVRKEQVHVEGEGEGEWSRSPRRENDTGGGGMIAPSRDDDLDR